MGAEGESDLIRKALEGDERAFRSILEKHYALIYSVARGIVGASGETEDVVQEVFIKIFRALPEFRGESKLSTWIYRIARNESLNARARQRVSSIPIDDCENLSADEEDPESSRRKRAAVERLERLMQRLDEKERLALELRYRGEKSYEEIAEIMDIPLGTVKTHLYRAKLSLKRMIGGAGTVEKGWDAS